MHSTRCKGRKACAPLTTETCHTPRNALQATKCTKLAPNEPEEREFHYSCFNASQRANPKPFIAPRSTLGMVAAHLSTGICLDSPESAIVLVICTAAKSAQFENHFLLRLSRFCNCHELTIFQNCGSQELSMLLPSGHSLPLWYIWLSS